MLMQERTYTTAGVSYRFGFNGMEEDDEVNGNGNSLDFGARIYDSRIGRWLALDPLHIKYPSYSPYSSFNNNPTIFIDPNGESSELTVRSETVHSFKATEYDADGVARGVDKITTKVYTYQTVKDDNGRTIMKFVQCTTYTATVDEDGNVSDVTYSRSGWLYQYIDGEQPQTQPFPYENGHSSGTLKEGEVPKVMKGYLDEVSDYKKENDISPIQAISEDREDVKEWTSATGKAATIGGGLVLIGNEAGVIPQPHAQAAGKILTGIGLTVLAVNELVQDDPENITVTTSQSKSYSSEESYVEEVTPLGMKNRFDQYLEDTTPEITQTEGDGD